MMFYLSSFVYSLRHLAVLLKQKVAHKNVINDDISVVLKIGKIYEMTDILSFDRSSVLLCVS